jgi:NADH-quinone oxidoreductase subunit F
VHSACYSSGVPLLLTRAPESEPETLEEYRSIGGYGALEVAHARGPEAVIEAVTAADLRGHGGAGFPVGRKWALARAAAGEPRFVIANGGEHEPGSRKDRHLVTFYPHRVLEGAALCALATAATTVWLYLIEDMMEAIASARHAIREAHEAGLLGGLAIEVALAPTTYVAGEETAALEVIEGRKAWPRKKPPYPGNMGLFGKPTTVNNVETLAHVPAILRGAKGAGQTMLFTLDERAVRPGVYELPLGATFRELIYGCGGGPRSGAGIKALLPALSSSFLTGDHLELPMTPDAVKAAGSGLGCGGVSFIEEGECIVERVLEIARFFMREQCGQCAPCRMETNTLATVMKQVQSGETGDYQTQVDKITSFARGKGFCSLIEMAAAPVVSALHHFPDDFSHHANTGTCSGRLARG